MHDCASRIRPQERTLWTGPEPYDQRSGYADFVGRRDRSRPSSRTLNWTLRGGATRAHDGMIETTDAT
jgi:hypothetical protein